MPLKISKRAKTIQASPIRKLLPFALKAKKDGKKIYHLNIGQPDIETPKVFFDNIKKFKNSVLAYGPSQGLLEYQEILVDYYNKYNFEINIDNVIITTGGSEAIIFAFMVVGDYGDEIIIPEPFYTNYNGFATQAGLKIVPLTTKAEDGFHLPEKSVIESKISSKTKAILICNPNNPTGTVYTKNEITDIIDLALKHNLFIIADEVYREFIYNGIEYTSVMDFKHARQNVIIVDSISKRFSSCGARIGALISHNNDIIKSVLKFAQARLCPPTLDQYGAIALHKLGKNYFEKIISEYKERRDIVMEYLKKIPNVLCKQPSGAFYVIAKLPIHDSEHFAQWLLTDFSIDNETVMVAPAQGFYATPNLGLDEIRIAYILNKNALKKAMQILEFALKQYTKK